jgi:ribosomal protein L16 Arg81 hydroxylase
VQQLLAGADAALLQRWLGTMLTEPKPNLALLPPEPPWQPEIDPRLLRAQGRLQRDGTSRLLYLRTDQGMPDLLFANGDCHELADGRAGFLAALSRRPGLTAEDAAPWLQDQDCVRMLTHLFNAGHFIADED